MCFKGTDNALSCSCEWGRPEELDMKEFLLEENTFLIGVLPLRCHLAEATTVYSMVSKTVVQKDQAIDFQSQM